MLPPRLQSILTEGKHQHCIVIIEQHLALIAVCGCYSNHSLSLRCGCISAERRTLAFRRSHTRAQLARGAHTDTRGCNGRMSSESRRIHSGDDGLSVESLLAKRAVRSISVSEAKERQPKAARGSGGAVPPLGATVPKICQTIYTPSLYMWIVPHFIYL